MTKVYKPIKESHSILNTDSFDRRRFSDLLTKSMNMKNQLKEGQEQLPSFHPLMSDVWSSLYKTTPKLKEKEDHVQTVNMNRDFVEKIMNLEGFSEFHKTTRLDDLSSAIGTLRYGEKVTEWVVEEKRKNEELASAINDALNQERNMEYINQQIEMLEKAMEAAKADGTIPNDSLQNQHSKNMEELKKQAEQTNSKLNQSMSKMQGEISRSMNHSNPSATTSSFNVMLQQALQETNDSKKMLENLFGLGAGTGASELKKVPLSDKIALAQIVMKNRKFRDIAQWAGRLKTIAQQKRKTKHSVSIERSGVITGTEVERLLPQELALYSYSSTKLDFLRRFSEEQTMMYSPEGKEVVGKGPIVICLDQSGSMSRLDDQSKGFVLALAMVAKKERRDFCLIPFASESEANCCYFKKGNIKGNDLVELATNFLGGGTLFIPALTKSIESIKKNRNLKKADIVFVTDGDPSDGKALTKFVDNDLQPFKDKHEVNIMSVLIGNQCKDHYVSTFSDRIIRANNFMNDEVTDVFTI